MAITVRFDGKVFVPEGPVEATVGNLYQLEPIPEPVVKVPSKSKYPLLDILEGLDELPEDPDWPEDGASQHDHYLYGTPKHTQ